VSRFGGWAALGLGLALTLAQVGCVCCWARPSSPGEAYLGLWHWDGGWYASIVEKGYFSPAPLKPGDFGNVAFFPAYPWLARQAKGLFALGTPLALLLTAQVCCWGFWTYLFLLCRSWRLDRRLVFWSALLIASHPASFYLVASYTESLFLMTTLGFFFWSQRPGPGAFFLTAGHGAAMTATRLVGLPLVLYPLVAAWFAGPDEPTPADLAGRLRRGVRPMLLGAVASLGALGFFAYCQIRFGHWDLYQRTAAVGWGLQPNYRALFSERIFHLHPDWSRQLLDGEFLSRLSVPVLLLALCALLVCEVALARARPETGWRGRVGLYLGAALLFYIPLSSQFSRAMTGMLRFSLCAYVLLVLAGLHLVNGTRLGTRAPAARLVLIAWLLLTGACQLVLAAQFIGGRWVS
jgi:hypothetical protein